MSASAPEKAKSLDSVDEKVEALPVEHDGEVLYLEPGRDAAEVSTGKIIRDGYDVSEYLLPIRDDGDPALTFRSVVLSILGGGFNATMFQIYQFKPTQVSLTGTFLVLILYFLGTLWATVLPRGDKLAARWAGKETRTRRALIRAAMFVNPGPFGLKEHAVAAITATSAASGVASIQVFTVQELFYGGNLSGTTVVLSTLSIALFGYGLTGLLRPITVYPSQMVYWSNLPQVAMYQNLHWDRLAQSKPLQAFWTAFAGMSLYEIVPAYIAPWLNSVSIPCLASMHAPQSKQQVLNNLFGGSTSNQGLGLFSLTFDWQYIQSFQTSLPLIQQANSWIGLLLCYVIFLAVYYGNGWNAQKFPFLSTRLYADDGSKYNSTAVFVNGVLDTTALQQAGLPNVTGTYAWAQMAGIMAIGALIAHAFLFWGRDAYKSIKESQTRQYTDRHQQAMSKYKEASWTWYLATLVLSFLLGLVVVIKEDITLPWWGYLVALLLGAVVSPFSTILYGMMGNGIATNQLMKMVAGSLLPGRPLANLYFSAWSHSTIAQSLNLASDLKLGQYLKIPPRTMFLTQVLGTIYGAFINYAVMISIVNAQRDLLVDSNGSFAWSGQAFQSLNTQATTWALSKYIYTVNGRYFLVPLSILFGAAAVVLQRVFMRYVPRLGPIATRDINLPVIFMYSGWLGFNQTQSCIMFSTVAVGIYVQYYLRNYRPRIFKDYSYLVAAGLDGGSLLVIFVLSFAVFGAAGSQHPFPTWFGNPSDYPDHCPDPSS